MDTLTINRPHGRGPKFQARREQLAQAALVTLAELGFAHTSLREIAQNSEFSHGVVHYYFSDKADLISECVASFRATLADGYADLIEAHADPEAFREAIVDRMSRRVSENWSEHRIWFDLRVQAMFDDSLRTEVASVYAVLYDNWRAVIDHYATLTATPAVVGPDLSQSLVDGVTQRAVSRYIQGDVDAIPALRRGVNALFDLIVPVDSTPA